LIGINYSRVLCVENRVVAFMRFELIGSLYLGGINFL
jgi:hypothetical protein